jgi:ribosomal protein S27AE
MGLGHGDYLALTDTGTRKATGGSWLEMLRQWLVQCPQCSEVRLVVGAHEKDRYICKDCGHSFVIGFQSRREVLKRVNTDKF